MVEDEAKISTSNVKANKASTMATASTSQGTKKVTKDAYRNRKVKCQFILWHQKRSKAIADEELELFYTSNDSDDSDYNPQLQKRSKTETSNDKSGNEMTPDRRIMENNNGDTEERVQRRTLIRRRKTNDSLTTPSDSEFDDVGSTSGSVTPKYNESRVLQNENLNENGKHDNFSTNDLSEVGGVGNNSLSLNSIKDTLLHANHDINQTNGKLNSDANVTNRNDHSSLFNGNSSNSPVHKIKNKEIIDLENTLLSISSTPVQKIVESDYDNSVDFSPSSSFDSPNTFQSEEKIISKISKISCTDFTPLPDRPEFGDQIEIHVSVSFPAFLNDEQMLKLLSPCGKVISWRRDRYTVSQYICSGVCYIKSVSSALRLTRVLDNFRINGFSISITPRPESQSTLKYFIKKLNSRFSKKDTLNGSVFKKEYCEWNYSSSNMNVLLSQGDNVCDIIAVRIITKYLRENNLPYHYGFVNDKSICYSREELLHLRSSSASLVLEEPILTSLSIIGIRSNKENNSTFIDNQLNCHRLSTDDVPQNSQTHELFQSQGVKEPNSDLITDQLTASPPKTATKGSFPFNISSYKIHGCSVKECIKKEKCPYFHNFEDKRRDLDLHKYRPRLCTLSSSCIRGENCNFSHNEFERFYHPDFFRTRPCTLNPCTYGNFCYFLHNNNEPDRNLPTTSTQQQPPDISQHNGMASTLGREDENSSDSGFKSPSISSLEKEVADSHVQSSNRQNINRENDSRHNSNASSEEHRKRVNEDDEILIMTARKRLKPNDISLVGNLQSSSSSKDNAIVVRPDSIGESIAPIQQMDSNQHPQGEFNSVAMKASKQVPEIVTLDSDDSDTPSDDAEVKKNLYSYVLPSTSNNDTPSDDAKVKKNLGSYVLPSTSNKKERTTYSSDRITDCFISLSKIGPLLGACSSIVTSLLIRATILNDKGENSLNIFENKDNIYLLNIVYHKLLCQITSSDIPDHLKEKLQETIEKVDEILSLVHIPVKKESLNNLNIDRLATAMKGKKKEQVVKFIEQNFNYMSKSNSCEDVKKVWTKVAPKLYEMSIKEQESKSGEALSTLLGIIPVSTKSSNDPINANNQENDLHIRQTSVSSIFSTKEEKISVNNALQTSISSISLEKSYYKRELEYKNKSDPIQKSDGVYKDTFAQSMSAHSRFNENPAPLNSCRENPVPLTSLFPGMTSNNSNLQKDSDARRDVAHLLSFDAHNSLINREFTQPSSFDAHSSLINREIVHKSSSDSRISHINREITHQSSFDARSSLINRETVHQSSDAQTSLINREMAHPSSFGENQSSHLSKLVSYTNIQNSLEKISSFNLPSNIKPIDDPDKRSLLLGFTPSPGKINQSYIQGTNTFDNQGAAAADMKHGSQEIIPQMSNTTFTPIPKLVKPIDEMFVQNIVGASNYDQNQNTDNLGKFSSSRTQSSKPSTSTNNHGNRKKGKRIIDELKMSQLKQSLQENLPQENLARDNLAPENILNQQRQQPSPHEEPNQAANDPAITALELAHLLQNYNSYDRKTKIAICDLVKNTKYRFPSTYEQTFIIKRIWERDGYPGQEG